MAPSPNRQATNDSGVGDSIQESINLPDLGRFIIGLTFVMVSVYAIDQKDSKLANAYIASLILGMLLVYNQQVSIFLDYIFEVTGRKDS